MKFTKDVGKLIHWRGRTGSGPTGLIKNSETKTNPTTSERNQMQIFRERKVVPEIFSIKSKKKKRDFNLPKKFPSCCQNSGCFSSSRWPVKQEIREL